MEEILFKRISFDITFRCTLRCKLCCSYAPYLHPIPHYTYQELAREILRFFELVDRTNVFTIGGGEPLLHEELPEILDLLYQFRDRIGRLEVITNGTIVPNQKLLQSLKQSNARVLVDDYGLNLSKKIPEILSLLQTFGITYEHRHNSDGEDGAYFNGWVDLSKFSEMPVPYEQAKKLFDKCIQAHELRCHPVIGGKIYACSSYQYCIVKNKISDDSDYYIDLLDDNTPLLEQKEKIQKFLEIDFLPSCAYCKGFCKDSKRFVPAEQLE